MFSKSIFTTLYVLWSAATLVWMAKFHLFSILAAVLIFVSLFFQERVRLGNRALGAIVVVALLVCFVCTRVLDRMEVGRFLGIGTMSLALLAGWLTAISLVLQKKGAMKKAPIVSSSALLVACSMSVETLSVVVVAGGATLLFALALREAGHLRMSPALTLPVLFVLGLMGGLAGAASWSETRLSSFLSLFAMSPSGIRFPPTTSLSALQNWNHSDLVVMRGYGKNPPLYLIGRSFEVFDQRNFWHWKTSKEVLKPVDQVLVDEGTSPRSVGLFVEGESIVGEPGPPFALEYPSPGKGYTFYTPAHYYGVGADLTRLHRYGDGMLQVLALDQFDGTYYLFPYSDGWERHRPPQPLTEETRKACLQLPEDLTPVVAERAEKVAGMVEDPEKKADFITAYLQNNFTYGYDYPFRSSKTALEEFLVKKPPAHCEFFATAGALMLRSQGVPTRYINGFVLQERSISGDYYVIRLKHAHAWLEAYIPGKGWLTYDPTPPGTLGSPQDSAGLGQAIVEWIKNSWNRFIGFFSLSPADMVDRVKSFIQGLTRADWIKIALLAACIGLFKLYRRRSGRKRTKPAPERVYRPGVDEELSPRLQKLSATIQPDAWHRKESETPKQWLARLRTSDLDDKGLQSVANFLDLFVRLRYGDEATEEQLSYLDQYYEQAVKALSTRPLEKRSSDRNSV